MLVKAKWRESNALIAWLMEEGAPALLGRLPLESTCSVGLMERNPWNSCRSDSSLPFDAIIEIWSSQAVATAAFASLFPHTNALHFTRAQAGQVPPEIRPRISPLVIWSFADGVELDNGFLRMRECLYTAFPDAEPFPYGHICPHLPHGSSPPIDMTILELRYPRTQGADLIAACQRLRQCSVELSTLTTEFSLFTVRWHSIESRPPAAECLQRDLQPWRAARRYEETATM